VRQKREQNFQLDFKGTGLRDKSYNLLATVNTDKNLLLLLILKMVTDELL
jgi:hypothetical protein